MSRWSLAALACLPFACADGVDEVGGVRINDAPLAALKAPVLAPAGRPVTLDAGQSVDPNGDALTFVFEPNDGSEPIASADASFTHAFAAPGLYTVVVRAIDMAGLEGRAAQDVAVRVDFPEPPDFCAVATDCVVGDLCEGGVCWSTGGSLE